MGQNYEDSTLCRMTFADVSESRRRQEQLRAQAVEMNELIDLVCGGVCLFKVTPEMHIECLYLNIVPALRRRRKRRTERRSGW